MNSGSEFIGLRERVVGGEARGARDDQRDGGLADAAGDRRGSARWPGRPARSAARPCRTVCQWVPPRASLPHAGRGARCAARPRRPRAMIGTIVTDIATDTAKPVFGIPKPDDQHT